MNGVALQQQLPKFDGNFFKVPKRVAFLFSNSVAALASRSGSDVAIRRMKAFALVRPVVQSGQRDSLPSILLIM